MPPQTQVETHRNLIATEKIELLLAAKQAAEDRNQGRKQGGETRDQAGLVRDPAHYRGGACGEAGSKIEGSVLQADGADQVLAGPHRLDGQRPPGSETQDQARLQLRARQERRSQAVHLPTGLQLRGAQEALRGAAKAAQASLIQPPGRAAEGGKQRHF